jgi:hypothetical protein
MFLTLHYIAPHVVIGIYYGLNPSGRNMALVSTQTLYLRYLLGKGINAAGA